jgi:GTP pyrophosphokinase
MVPIDYELQNGEAVDIISQSNAKGPSMDWLSIAKSSHARSKIRQWLKKQDKSQNVDKGKDVLEKAVRRKGYDPKDVMRVSWLTKISKQLNYTNVSDLYSALSYGGAIVSKVINKLVELYQEEYDKKVKTDSNQSLVTEVAKNAKNASPAGKPDVVLEGMDNLMIRLSRCCSPVPGDDIIGFITKGRGVSVHRSDCPNILFLPEKDKERLIHVDWESTNAAGTYNANLTIQADDRKGLFSDISRCCLDMDVNISGANMKTNENKTVNIALTLSISNINEMENIFRKLKQIESVTEVYRTRG